MGPTRGAFLRPSRGWLLRSFSLYDPTVSEAVGRDCKEKILSFFPSAAPSVSMRSMTTAKEAAAGTTCGVVGREC